MGQHGDAPFLVVQSFHIGSSSTAYRFSALSGVDMREHTLAATPLPGV